MRRSPPYLAAAGLELARYFALAFAAGPFAEASASANQVLRLLAAPNAMFAVAFLFLGMDAGRYAAYRPLVLVGKAVAVFSGAVALPRLLGTGGEAASEPGSRYALLLVIAWDVLVLALLALPVRRRRTPEPLPTEPEPVELD